MWSDSLMNSHCFRLPCSLTREQRQKSPLQLQINSVFFVLVMGGALCSHSPHWMLAPADCLSVSTALFGLVGNPFFSIWPSRALNSACLFLRQSYLTLWLGLSLNTGCSSSSADPVSVETTEVCITTPAKPFRRCKLPRKSLKNNKKRSMNFGLLIKFCKHHTLI